ncbi:putative glutathione S-transferase [Gymnopus androsaceus JB14]|uniref:Glutathione S-transferase n=1 Tax=Gymnopus androsaceus JB14 TaxID=1447944 RepID=A0A6A4I2C3_9AGAR|nr:putative glutathione S-transferase [Gymnopus androsaceus JB14]
MLTVHHLQNSQSERIPWLCEELEIPYDLKLYERDPILAPASLKALTPMQASPVITDEETDPDFVLSESGAIVEYIIHKYGSGRLALPPSHPDYADYLHWFHFANGNLQPAMSGLFRVAVTDVDPEHPIYNLAANAVRKVLAHVEQRVGEATWLAGDEFTAADVMNFWSLTGMRVFTPLDLSGYPNILTYMERIANRKAYKVAMEKGDRGRESCLGGPPPKVFAGLGKTYTIFL